MFRYDLARTPESNNVDSNKEAGIIPALNSRFQASASFLFTLKESFAESIKKFGCVIRISEMFISHLRVITFHVK